MACLICKSVVHMRILIHLQPSKKCPMRTQKHRGVFVPRKCFTYSNRVLGWKVETTKLFAPICDGMYTHRHLPVTTTSNPVCISCLPTSQDWVMLTMHRAISGETSGIPVKIQKHDPSLSDEVVPRVEGERAPKRTSLLIVAPSCFNRA